MSRIKTTRQAREIRDAIFDAEQGWTPASKGLYGKAYTQAAARKVLRALWGEAYGATVFALDQAVRLAIEEYNAAHRGFFR